MLVLVHKLTFFTFKIIYSIFYSLFLFPCQSQFIHHLSIYSNNTWFCLWQLFRSRVTFCWSFWHLKHSFFFCMEFLDFVCACETVSENYARASPLWDQFWGFLFVLGVRRNGRTYNFSLQRSETGRKGTVFQVAREYTSVEFKRVKNKENGQRGILTFCTRVVYTLKK